MQISDEEASVVTQTLAQSSSFITRQLLKLLATSAEELEFPFPYEHIRISPTSYKDRFIILDANDLSEQGELNLEKLVKRLIAESSLSQTLS